MILLTYILAIVVYIILFGTGWFGVKLIGSYTKDQKLQSLGIFAGAVAALVYFLVS